MSMKTDKNTITSVSQPKSTQVDWLDTSGDKPVLKKFINGKWTVVSGGDQGNRQETDPLFSDSPAGQITDEDIHNWNSNINKQELDPIFSNSPAGQITNEDIQNWNNIQNLEQNLKQKQQYIRYIQVETTPQSLDQNTVYDFGAITGSKTFPMLAREVNLDRLDELFMHYIVFRTSQTAPTITWPPSITSWSGEIPVIEANKYYEVSVLNGVGVCVEADLP